MEVHGRATDLGNLLRRKTNQPKSAFDHSWKETRMLTGTQRLERAGEASRLQQQWRAKVPTRAGSLEGGQRNKHFSSTGLLHQEGGGLLEGSQLGV